MAFNESTTKKIRRPSLLHFTSLFVLLSMASICLIYLANEFLTPEIRTPLPTHSVGNTTPSEVDPSHVTQNCSPVHHLLFLKTHKTGSSTMTNMFFRYGDSRDLIFVHPLPPLARLGWPARFRLSYSIPLFSEKPNILCSHARFNKKPMNWLLPKETSKYITILRNPVDNFESWFNFNLDNFAKQFGLEDELDSLETFLSNKTPSNGNGFLSRNPMLFDLGLSFEFFQNRTAVNDYIQFLEKEFDLVMIMDYFDESLVLMKRLLCWDMDDILYIKLNERRDDEKAGDLSDNVRENIKSWNQADVLLFNHFNQTLFNKIKMEGQSFYDELAAFRQRIDEITRVCIKNGTSLQEAYPGKLVQGYSLREGLPEKLQVMCGRMIRFENSHLGRLRKKHDERLQRNGVEPRGDWSGDTTDWEVAQDLAYQPVASGWDENV